METRSTQPNIGETKHKAKPNQNISRNKHKHNGNETKQ